jgi:ABC-type cobalamin/Fe3+-siderophores transport system ATPase subunit
MWLSTVKISSYQSLEEVELDRLDQFNVLIGRNNSGKSSIFSSLSFLDKVLHGEDAGEPNRRLTGHDQGRSVGIHICFRPSNEERAEFLQFLATAYQDSRRTELLHSAFLRQLRLILKAHPGAPQTLHLRETALMTEDSRWATIQRVKDLTETSTNPTSSVVNFAEFATRNGGSRLETSLIDLGNPSIAAGDCRITAAWNQPAAAQTPKEFHWLLTRVAGYFRTAFFFSPYRHSEARMPAQQSESLLQDGSNLAQVLFTIGLNSPSKYRLIEEFVHLALPDIGALRTPLLARDTEIAFQQGVEDFRIRLHEMGGGVEQLLMVATMLLTTPDSCTLFLEEPESHLHAGAQRFLIEKLHGGNRQVFLTTHSPVFVNAAKSKSLYQVAYVRKRTTITRVKGAGHLAMMLADIGARNSDLLLSDAVLFVEGPSDKSVIEIWSETLDKSFAEHNVTVLPMGGGEHAGRGAPVRSEVLEGISQQSPIRHLFLLDHDERSKGEIEHLLRLLPDRVCVLNRRELENYMLVPRALRAAIRNKCRDDSDVVARVDQATDEQVVALMRAEAEKLRDLVLLKRIRSRLGGLAGGLLHKEMVAELVPLAHQADLGHVIKSRVQSRLLERLDGAGIDTVVNDERRAVDVAWADAAQHLVLAPGEEILAAIFAFFGTTYHKPGDTKAIAQELRRCEIHEEIRVLIDRVVQLAREAACSE